MEVCLNLTQKEITMLRVKGHSQFFADQMCATFEAPWNHLVVATGHLPEENRVELEGIVPSLVRVCTTFQDGVILFGTGFVVQHGGRSFVITSREQLSFTPFQNIREISVVPALENHFSAFGYAADLWAKDDDLVCLSLRRHPFRRPMLLQGLLREEMVSDSEEVGAMIFLLGIAMLDDQCHETIHVMEGTIVSLNAKRALYRISSIKGMAGGPVFDRNWNCCGVHLAMRHTSTGGPMFAVLTQERLTGLLQYTAAVVVQ